MGNDRTLAFATALLVAGCATPDEGPWQSGSSGLPPSAVSPPGERLGEGAAPIQGGAPDPRDAAVVGIILLDDHDFVRRTCSGTLIAPNLVLTAQHCVADTAPFVDCRNSSFGPVVEAQSVRVTTSPSMFAIDVDWLRAAAVHPPPGGHSVCGRDLALVELAAPVDPAFATPVPPALDASPERAEGYSAVGYGATRGGADDGGLRRRRDALRVVCVGGACDSRQVMPGEWRGDHGICNGDSGGPALDRRGSVIGVTSRGPTGCEDPIYGGLWWHAPWLREIGRGAARAGAYAEPSWTAEPPAGSGPRPSCAAAPPGEAGAPATQAGAGWALAALGLLSVAYRRGGMPRPGAGCPGARLLGRARFRRSS